MELLDLGLSFLRLLKISGTGLLFYVLAKVIAVALDSDLRKLPGPWASSFTNLPLKIAVLSGNRSSYIHALHEKYGPFVRIAPTEVAVADIDAWREIHRVGSQFRKNAGWYQRQSPIQHNDETCGVFGLCDPKKASARRRLFQQAGTKKIVAEWEPRIIELTCLTVQRMKQELRSGGCDVMKWWTLMASDVAGELAFGEDFEGVQNGKKNQMIQDIEGAMPLIGLRMELSWVFNILMLTPYRSPIAQIWKRFDMYGKRAVANTRQAISRGNTRTLFSKMLPDDGSQRLPDSIIEQEAQNVLIAGTDTTAMTLTYLTYSVLKNEKIKQALTRELQTCPEHPTGEHLESLTYLNNVIQEAMRWQPAVPGSLPRIVPEGGATFGKYALPAGTIVSTQAWTFHRNPDVFVDPAKFDPDRWSTPTPHMRESMMVFGGPARICVGQNIARLVLLHAVSTFFRDCGNTKLAPSTDDESMRMVDFFAIKPKAGVFMIVPE